MTNENDEEIDMDEEVEKGKIGTGFGMIIAILVAVVAILLVMEFGGQDSSMGPNSMIENISQNVSEDDIGLTDKDKDFKTWLSMSYTPISHDLKCISNAAKKRNFTEIELCAKFLKQDSNRSLEQINEHNISVNIQNIVDEYKMSLEDFNIGGTCLETGAKNRDTRLMANGSNHIKNGTDHINRMSAMYSDLFPKSGSTTKLASRGINLG